MSLACLVVVWSLLGGGNAPGGSAIPLTSATALRPNILVVSVDDMAITQDRFLPETLAYFAAHGVVFTRAYATTPLCCPSRASLLRGQYAHNTGLRFNNSRHPRRRGAGGATAFRDLGLEQDSLGPLMQAAGYSTSYCGKYLNGYGDLAPYVPPGWDDWHVFAGDFFNYFSYDLAENGSLRSYGAEESDYGTDVIARKARRFVRRAPDVNRPWFLHVGLFAPHEPATPAPRHEALYPDLVAPRGASFLEEDISDKPRFLEERTFDAAKIADNDATFQAACRTLAAVDEAFLGLIQVLRETSQLRNTVIVLASDNGFSYLAHRWPGKRGPWEECSRVSLMVSHPGSFSRPRTSKALVALIDLLPTFLDLAGMEALVPAGTNGRSLVGVLRGETPDEEFRSELLLEHWCDTDQGEVCTRPSPAGEPPQTVPCTMQDYFTIITREGWKYTEWPFEGEEELYNLRLDSAELESVHRRPEYDAIRLDLRSRLALLKVE